MSYLPPLQRGTEGDLLLAARIKSPFAKGGKSVTFFWYIVPKVLPYPGIIGIEGDARAEAVAVTRTFQV
jgi:hypothetical protein